MTTGTRRVRGQGGRQRDALWQPRAGCLGPEEMSGRRPPCRTGGISCGPQKMTARNPHCREVERDEFLEIICKTLRYVRASFIGAQRDP